MELLRLATVLARRRFVVLESLAVFTLVAVLVVLFAPRTYTASARVLIAPSDTTASILTDLDLAEIATGMTAASKDIENHIALATTRPVLDEVIWRLQLRDRDGRLYDAHEILAPSLFARFFAQPSVTVSPQQGTHLLVFTASAPDPETARLLADTVVAVAIETTGAHAQDESRRARERVESQLGVVKNEIAPESAESDPAQGVYDTLEKQRYQIAVAEQIRLSDLQLVESAGTPARPSFPRPLFQIAMGILVGALVGVGSALLLEYVDDSVKSPEDLAAGIRDLGWKDPMPVQARVVPAMQRGGDLIVQARTGSGKTGAFGIPILLSIDTDLAAPQALVMKATGNSLPAKTGPVPSMNCVTAGSFIGGISTTMAVPSTRIVPILRNAER